MKDTGKVNIHGKEYETVASRVQRLRDSYKDGISLTTEIVHRDESEVVMKATILDKDGRVIATGHAEEQRSSSQINRTSALENAETSAIGRALAAFGMAGTEFASADEVAQAIGQQKTPHTASRPSVGTAKGAAPSTRKLVTEAQVKLLGARARDASGLTDRQEVMDWFVERFDRLPTAIYMDEVTEILNAMEAAAVFEER